jgi:folate-binding protein YgfZ
MSTTIPVIFQPQTYGLLQVSGVDAKKLLQGQLSCNLDNLTTSNILLGAHCSSQGRVLVLLRLFFFAQDYYLVMPQEMLQTALTLLSKYAIFYKVTLHDASTQPQQILHCLAKAAWSYFNVKLGRAQIYLATSNKFLPHELNLPKLGGISWDKGCYTGQEIIARMHYRSNLKNTLYKINLRNNTPPPRGAIILSHDQQNHGKIVDYAHNGDNCYQVLIVSKTNPGSWRKPLQIEFVA